jgi:serine/threonine protein phosphatase 1
MACIWNVDTGAAFKGPLTIMDVDTKEFWQSEPLNTLYFDEKGKKLEIIKLISLLNL